MARSLGRSSTEFRKGLKEGGKEPEESAPEGTKAAESKPSEKTAGSAAE